MDYLWRASRPHASPAARICLDMSSFPSLRTVARRLTLIAGSAALVAGCGTTDSTSPDIPSNPSVETYAASTGVVIAQMTRVSDNLYTRDMVVGTGAQAVSGDNIVVTYRGMLTSGQVFDQGTIDFQLGVGRVIPGWDQGVAGMRVGGKRQLVIGSSLAYRNQRAGAIPPNSTLVFDVTLDRVVGK
jgi:FKBP-type peptidyl-prolyl cis-trans isomerase FkpA